MSARLTALFDELETKLKAKYGANVITFGRRADAKEEHGAPPRVVWVRTVGRFTAAEKKDGRKVRSILTRNLNVEARCWGADEDAAEQLLHDVVLALHESAWGSMQIVGEEWPPEAATQHGVLVVLTFTPMIPVKEPVRTAVQVTTFEKDTTGSAQGDGNLDWGEP